jgi:hypothetical protein
MQPPERDVRRRCPHVQAGHRRRDHEQQHERGTDQRPDRCGKIRARRNDDRESVVPAPIREHGCEQWQDDDRSGQHVLKN